MLNIIWGVIVLLFVLWLVGLVMHLGGAFIHILLVIAVALLIFNFVTKGKATL